MLVDFALRLIVWLLCVLVRVCHLLTGMRPHTPGAEGEAGTDGVSGAGSSIEGESAIPTRARHRVQLHAALDALDAFLACSNTGAELELAAEELRIAVSIMSSHRARTRMSSLRSSNQ